MEIEFTDFELKHRNNDAQCALDFLMVYDGDDDEGDVIGDDILLPKTCSDKVPEPFTSKSIKVQVHIENNGSWRWRLVYTEL